ncbi:MAG: type II 3-dehydroquinate dehydratase [Candidatus Firestonebacteria bacterium GWA2_43_8]|nr:MAG: type II 3-dehydroquinate dehydratase [Candidatus Firestonebacteria bacterium GWA2_43_8]
MKNILVIHGPNLNILGKREPDIYGKVTLDSINKELKALAIKNKVGIKIFQTNTEGEIVDIIQKEGDTWADALVINPAAYTHTSVAIRDAISAVKIPAVEVHLSNIFKREEFRHKSFISSVAAGGVFGFGKESYILGFLAAVNISKTKR